MDEPEVLTGGGVNEVIRFGNTVRRPAGPWRPLIHELLRHLRQAGFTAAPAPHGITEDGFAILDFLPGVVAHHPLPAAARTREALVSAAELLRAYHDATVEFAAKTPRDGWQLPAVPPSPATWPRGITCSTGPTPSTSSPTAPPSRTACSAAASEHGPRARGPGRRGAAGVTGPHAEHVFLRKWWGSVVVSDELRALLRADLGDERPPPLGDVVGAALRDGRRIRRRRRWAAFGSAGAVFVIAAVAAVMVVTGPSGRPSAMPVAALPPGSVPSAVVSPVTAAPTRTVTVRSGTERAEGMLTKATPAAMLHLLTTLLPPGRTSHYGVAADNDLHVQVYYDAGYGPSMLRLAVERAPVTGRRPDRGSIAKVSVGYRPDDCVQDTVVEAAWPDGTTVHLDVASCLAFDGVRNPPAKPQLSEAVALLIVSDARWGVTMDVGLVKQGAQQFPDGLPVFAS